MAWFGSSVTASVAQIIEIEIPSSKFDTSNECKRVSNHDDNIETKCIVVGKGIAGWY